MLPDILSFQDKKYLEIFKNFLDNGDRGFFAYLDGTCVHRTWVKLGPQEVKLHHFWKKQLLEDELFIHYCETAEEARGKSIYPAVLAKVVKDFKENYTIYISTALKNKASIKSIKKAGFKEKERKKITAFFGLKQIKTIQANQPVQK
jgi:sulfur relay (sulfurtransferase) complex TusBCD TusD component (DsrE family)